MEQIVIIKALDYCFVEIKHISRIYSSLIRHGFVKGRSGNSNYISSLTGLYVSIMGLLPKLCPLSAFDIID